MLVCERKRGRTFSVCLFVCLLKGNVASGVTSFVQNPVSTRCAHARLAPATGGATQRCCGYGGIMLPLLVFGAVQVLWVAASILFCSFSLVVINCSTSSLLFLFCSLLFCSPPTKEPTSPASPDTVMVREMKLPHRRKSASVRVTSAASLFQRGPHSSTR